MSKKVFLTTLLLVIVGVILLSTWVRSDDGESPDYHPEPTISQSQSVVTSTPSADCGNGVAENGETAENCPQDAVSGPSAIEVPVPVPAD